MDADPLGNVSDGMYEVNRAAVLAEGEGGGVGMVPGHAEELWAGTVGGVEVWAVVVTWQSAGAVAVPVVGPAVRVAVANASPGADVLVVVEWSALVAGEYSAQSLAVHVGEGVGSEVALLQTTGRNLLRSCLQH